MREPRTCSTVIGSRKLARGFLAAHSRCTTATFASFSSLRPQSFMYRSTGIVNIVGAPIVP